MSDGIFFFFLSGRMYFNVDVVTFLCHYAEQQEIKEETQ